MYVYGTITLTGKLEHTRYMYIRNKKYVIKSLIIGLWDLPSLIWNHIEIYTLIEVCMLTGDINIIVFTESSEIFIILFM